MVFGYGHLTWEWAAGLRGYLHPSLFAALFWGLRVLGLDSAWAVVRGPMLLQALFAAATDMSVYATTKLLFGQQAARWSLACQLMSWFNFYCSTRTYSNCLEALLTSAAAYQWLLSVVARSSRGSAHRPAGAALTSTSGSVDVNGSGGVCFQAGGGGSGKEGEGGVLEGGGTGVGARLRSRVGPVPAACIRSAPGKNIPAPGAPSAGNEARRHQRAWLLLAALAVVLRPPSALFWGALGLHQLLAMRTLPIARALLLDAACIMSACLLLATLWDRLHYGRWVLVPWQFLHFNLLEGQSALFGAHPWHWNLAQGFPAVSATLLPLMGGGLVLSGERRPAALAALSLAAYSLPAHKELRFLLPALTLAMPYCGPALAWLLGGQRGAAAIRGSQQDGGGRRAKQTRWLAGRGVGLLGAALLAVPQVLAASHFSLVQHRGLAAVPSEVRRLWERSPGAVRVLFLTQCHATPWYSHLHTRVPMRFLDCSPPGWAPAVAQLNAAEMGWLRLPEPPPCPSAAPGAAAGPAQALHQGACTSQQQLFRANPLAFLQGVFALNAEPPTVLVAYPQQLGGEVLRVLQQRGYEEHRRLGNCWWQTDDDTPCLLTIWVRDA